MALRGAPLGRQERLNRQSLASSLKPPPEIYKYLVFGEKADTGALLDGTPGADPPPQIPRLKAAAVLGRKPRDFRTLFTVINPK